MQSKLCVCGPTKKNPGFTPGTVPAMQHCLLANQSQELHCSCPWWQVFMKQSLFFNKNFFFNALLKFDDMSTAVSCTRKTLTGRVMWERLSVITLLNTQIEPACSHDSLSCSASNSKQKNVFTSPVVITAC